jgi:hypothetical protein
MCEEERIMAGRIDLSGLVERWPSEIVAREAVGRFSGGVLSPKYMANIDSLGEGPDETIRIGRKVAYFAKSLAAWMEARAERRGPRQTP